MRWVQHSITMARSLSVTLSTLTLVLSPVAQGAEAQKATETAIKESNPAREIASVKPLGKLPATPYNYNVDKKLIQEFMKFNNLGKKKVTVGEFYSKMRKFYPETFRNDLDQWATLHRSDLMPEIQVSTYKGAENKDQVRMVLTMPDKKTVTLSFDSESDKKFLQFNNVSLTKKDMLYYEQAFRKVANLDKDANKATKGGYVSRFKRPVVIGYEEYVRLNPTQRAQYLVNLRTITEAAQHVHKAYGKSQALNEHEQFQEAVVAWFLGATAEAATSKKKSKVSSSGGGSSNAYSNPIVGDNCVINGYISEYGENSSCAGSPSGRAHLMTQIEKYGGQGCSGNTLPCNPFVYGYDVKNGGGPICVAPSEQKYATSGKCPGESPLRLGTPDETADKKRIIESYMLKKTGKAIDLQFNEDGKLSKDQYALITEYLDGVDDGHGGKVGGLNSFIDQAVDKCLHDPLLSIKKNRDDQATACKAIADRKILIDTYDVVNEPAPVPPLPPPAPQPRDCNVEKPNSVQEGNGCVCVAPLVEIMEEGRPLCGTVENTTTAKDDGPCPGNNSKRDEHGVCIVGAGWAFNSKALWIGALAFLGIGAFFYLNKDKKDPKPTKPAQIPKPFDPCPPAPYACTGQGQTPTTPPMPPQAQLPPPILVVVTPTPAPTTAPPPGEPEKPPVVTIPPIAPEDTSGTATSVPAASSVRGSR